MISSVLISDIIIILIALKPSLTFSPWRGGSWCPQPQDRVAEGSELLHTALLSAGGVLLYFVQMMIM